MSAEFLTQEQAERLAGSKNTTVYNYEYEEHEPWKVERMRKAIALLKEGKYSDPEVKAFRSHHPNMACMVRNADANAFRGVELMMQVREQVERKEITKEQSSALVQAALLEMNRSRQEASGEGASGDAGSSPSPPPSGSGIHVTSEVAKD